LTVTETCNIVLITAECLSFVGFYLKRAKLLTDDLPHNLIRAHFCSVMAGLEVGVVFSVGVGVGGVSCLSV
jgi:uncharacterized membrane-anchored protein YitT (DUF2179 family)